MTGFAATAIAVLVVAGASVASVGRVRAGVEELVTGHVETMADAERLRAEAEQVVASGRAYLLTGRERYLERSRAAREEVEATLARLRTRGRQEGRIELESVERAEEAYHAAFVRAIQLRREDPDPDALARFFEEQMRPRREALDAALNALGRRERGAFDASLLAAERRAWTAGAFIAVVAAAALAAHAVVALVVTRRLTGLHEAAERATGARDRVLAVVAHELRSPLNALAFQLRLLRTGAPAAERAARRIDAIGDRVARIVRLLDTLLDVSRVESGRLELELADVDLAGLVADVVASAEAEIAAAGCPLALSAAGPVVGRWDALRLEQLVRNLLSNALKYGAGKAVALRLEHDAETARLIVQDHGVGIAPGDMVRLFSPFERGARVRDTAGFGLGLFIAKAIALGFGGRIDVASEPGRGTTFTVTLPRGRAPEAPASAA